MKFEEVLPEMRKGRRARFKNTTPFFKLEDAVLFRISEVLSYEFELEPIAPQTVTITRKQLAEVWDNYMSAFIESGLAKSDRSSTFALIAAALGFKDGVE